MAYVAEVFAYAYHALADDEVNKVLAYAEVLNKLEQIINQLFENCKKLHSRITGATGG